MKLYFHKIHIFQAKGAYYQGRLKRLSRGLKYSQLNVQVLRWIFQIECLLRLPNPFEASAKSDQDQKDDYE